MENNWKEKIGLALPLTDEQLESTVRWIENEIIPQARKAGIQEAVDKLKLEFDRDFSNVHQQIGWNEAVAELNNRIKKLK